MSSKSISRLKRHIKSFFKKLLPGVFPDFSNVKVIIFGDGSEKVIRYARQLPRKIRIKNSGVKNVVKIHKNIKSRNIHISFSDKCIENICVLEDSLDSTGIAARIVFLDGIKTELRIGKGTSMNGTEICLGDGSRCIIGDNCMFSYNIVIRTTDGHTIVERDTTNILNLQKRDCVIGNHCWIGLRTIINKNTQLPDNTIVGSGSVLSGCFSKPYTVIAGNPAKVIKENVEFFCQNIDTFKRIHNL